MDFYNDLNLIEIEYLVNLMGERLVVPKSENDGVLCDEVICASINGVYIDIITNSFMDAMEEEKDRQVKNLINNPKKDK